MLTLWALDDGAEQALAYSGTLCALDQSEPFFTVRIRKKIFLPGLGGYIKEEPAPCYRAGHFRRVLARQSKTDMPCLGAVSTRRSGPAEQYVSRKIGPHLFCLPVYPANSFSGLVWRPGGYFACDRGYLVVVRRRVWSLIFLTLFVVLWLLLCYGAAKMGVSGLKDWLLSCAFGLWQTLHACWDGFWVSLFG